jgi:Holliday junction resolvase-like predicted endonuclease
MSNNITKAICENLVINELLRKGWHVVNLNAINNTPNADLIAIKNKNRITIQVKGMDGNEDKSFRHHVTFSRVCTEYLDHQIPFFNAKKSPVKADYFVGVTQTKDGRATFLVMPVREAERVARKIASWWGAVPKRDGSKRSGNFASMVAIRLEGVNSKHPEHMKFYRSVEPYIENWKILEGKTENQSPG